MHPLRYVRGGLRSAATSGVDRRVRVRSTRSLYRSSPRVVASIGRLHRRTWRSLLACY